MANILFLYDISLNFKTIIFLIKIVWIARAPFPSASFLYTRDSKGLGFFSLNGIKKKEKKKNGSRST